jgi:4-hydroxy-tetrahydrodipicolinate reductase
MISIVVSGVCGRMGQKIVAGVGATDDLRIRGAVEASGHPMVGKELQTGIVVSSELSSCLESSDVLVEFSAPAATVMHLETARAMKAPVLIGTTGLTEQQDELIRGASAEIPILKSHNYGVGMNVFWEIVRQATRYLGEDYDIEIVEFHGRAKPDVPSGTGSTIARIIAAERGQELRDVACYGREKSTTNKRKDHEIGIHSLRAGSYRSDHTVIFAGDGERLEFVHREEDLKIIVRGVLWGVRFLREQRAGLYGMDGVLEYMQKQRG